MAGVESVGILGKTLYWFYSLEVVLVRITSRPPLFHFSGVSNGRPRLVHTDDLWKHRVEVQK